MVDVQDRGRQRMACHIGAMRRGRRYAGACKVLARRCERYGADYGGGVGAGDVAGEAISFLFPTYEGGMGEKLVTVACRDLVPGV